MDDRSSARSAAVSHDQTGLRPPDPGQRPPGGPPAAALVAPLPVGHRLCDVHRPVLRAAGHRDQKPGHPQLHPVPHRRLGPQGKDGDAGDQRLGLGHIVQRQHLHHGGAAPGRPVPAQRPGRQQGARSRRETTGTSFGAEVLRWVILLLPFLVIFYFWRRLSKRGGAGGGLQGVLGAGRSKAKVFDEERPKTTFADVAGYEGAKAEIAEVVDFLQTPRALRPGRGHGPPGLLMVGPPGTGKTLLARAVAGEASVPFFSVTGSSFVEMFVGVGAARVRDLFAEARKRAPAIIFIDEIDAIGQRRGGAGPWSSNDEREQTLNQLLAEMDGFDPAAGIVVLAATNRPEVLDPALLRPGPLRPPGRPSRYPTWPSAWPSSRSTAGASSSTQTWTSTWWPGARPGSRAPTWPTWSTRPPSYAVRAEPRHRSRAADFDEARDRHHPRPPRGLQRSHPRREARRRRARGGPRPGRRLLATKPTRWPR